MARKKYYQSKKDRMDESRGMKRYERRMVKDRVDESRGMREYEDEKRARMRRDRRDESEGMKRYYRDKSMVGGEQRGYDNDRGMLYEDRYAVSNMPQDVKYHQYPEPYYGRVPRYLNDSLRGVDDQIDDDVREMVRHEKPEKY